MDEITISFAQPIQVSVQVGDIAYYTNAEMGETVVKIGEITAISGTSIVCNIGVTTVRPDTDSFILFTKNNIANTSGLVGYFAQVEMRNDSTDKGELFLVGSEIFESSK